MARSMVSPASSWRGVAVLNIRIEDLGVWTLVV
jgi:hypothetical protein